ncbi:MAG: hypothetical protein QOJ26_1618, partial [Thermoplasmata archaeon]|nr:hypothetical protein [Thermoplasmata archaeon]
DDEPAGAGDEGKKRTRHHDRPDDEREGEADEADEADAGPTNAAGVVGVASGSAGGGPVRAAPSDLGLAILPTALPGRAQFSFLVSAVGAFDGAQLSAALPDTGAPWTLSGPGAAACRLAGIQLDCTFDGFAPGDVRLVQASSPVARAPPWALSAAGQVGPAGGNAAAGDAAPGNDEASADLGLLLD